MAKTKEDNILNIKEGTMKNECAKSRKIDNPYEVWQTPDGSWTWRVLRKYQAPDKEAENPYARWMCAVQSPFLHGGWEYGDVYVRDIKSSARRI